MLVLLPFFNSVDVLDHRRLRFDCSNSVALHFCFDLGRIGLLCPATIVVVCTILAVIIRLVVWSFSSVFSSRLCCYWGRLCWFGSLPVGGPAFRQLRCRAG